MQISLARETTIRSSSRTKTLDTMDRGEEKEKAKVEESSGGNEDYSIGNVSTRTIDGHFLVK